MEDQPLDQRVFQLSPAGLDLEATAHRLGDSRAKLGHPRLDLELRRHLELSMPFAKFLGLLEPMVAGAVRLAAREAGDNAGLVTCSSS